ncbi:MAG: hypothetical protein KKG04_05560 [Candidatus Thermoplasmatota archaeon]|nr:hypothetical protein [Candidatus Thermoplasmatota archaeon]
MQYNFFSIVLISMFFFNCILVIAEDTDATSDDYIIWNNSTGVNGPDKITLRPYAIRKISYTANRSIMRLTIHFDSEISRSERGLRIIIVKNESINYTNPLNFESSLFETSNIRSNFSIDLSVVNGETYQILFENLVPHNISFTAEGIELIIVGNSFSLLIPCIMGGLVLIIAIIFLYKSRALITEEKKELNHTLQQLILLKKIDPNKVLEIVDGMYESANKEGVKLTKAFSKVTDRVSQQTKKQ